MYSVFNTDRYIIRKNYHLVDIKTLIDAVMSSNNPAEAGQILSQAPHPLEHDDITGVEADAAKYAYDHGLAPDEVRRAFHEGPQNPMYQKAFEHLVTLGAPHINKAIGMTNQMKGSYIPPAFDSEGRVTQRWREGGISVRDQNNKVPVFDTTGKLITQIRSSYTGEPEAFSRPYHEGLNLMRQQQGIKVKTSDEIKPSLVHRNTVNIQDGRMLSRFFNTIKQGVGADPNADPYELAHGALRQDNRFPVHSGLQHSEFGPARYSPETLEQQPAIPQSPADSMDQWLGPTRDAKWVKHLGNNNYYKQGGSKKQINDMVAHHGMSEQEAKDFFQKVYYNEERLDGGYNKRFREALRNWHMRDGVAPDWIEQAQVPQGSPLSAQQPEEQKTVETQPQPAPPAIVAPSIPEPPREPPAPAPQRNAPVVSAPPAQLTPPPPPPPPPAPPVVNNNRNQSFSGQNSTVGLPPSPSQQAIPPRPPMQVQNNNAYPSPPPPKQQGRIGAMLNNFIERLGYGYETLLPGINKSEDLNDVELVREALEKVQIEIAKSEVHSHQNNLSIHSYVDVNTIAATMRRPPSDIVTIVESRGDWPSLAKSWGMKHSEVQKIKVMFNE